MLPASPHNTSHGAWGCISPRFYRRQTLSHWFDPIFYVRITNNPLVECSLTVQQANPHTALDNMHTPHWWVAGPRHMLTHSCPPPYKGAVYTWNTTTTLFSASILKLLVSIFFQFRKKRLQLRFRQCIQFLFRQDIN